MVFVNHAERKLKMLDVLLDALMDTLKLIPYLFVTFLLLEIIEHKFSKKSEKILENNKKFGPFIGGLLGGLPQCGFSAIASNLSEFANKSLYKFWANVTLSDLSASLHSDVLGSLNSSSTVFHINSLAWSRSATHHISTTICVSLSNC